MLIELFRTTSNHLYTEGQLAVNDKHQIYTVEATEYMLPTGQYLVKLSKGKNRRREITIFQTPSPLNPSTLKTTGWKIGPVHSWIKSRKTKTIVIGQPLIPGALFNGIEHYERLFDRIEKCEKRGEPITLEITERYVVENNPIRYWMKNETRNSKLMKKSIFILLTSAILMGCGNTRDLPKVEIVSHTIHDTLYSIEQMYDSIYVYQSVEKDYIKGTPNLSSLTPQPDTVLIREMATEYRYKLLRDTVRLHKVDSIPVIKQVEITKEVQHIPWWSKVLNWIGAISLNLTILFVIRKVFNR